MDGFVSGRVESSLTGGGTAQYIDGGGLGTSPCIVSGRPTDPTAWQPLHVHCQVDPGHLHTPGSKQREAWEGIAMP